RKVSCRMGPTSACGGFAHPLLRIGQPRPRRRRYNKFVVLLAPAELSRMAKKKKIRVDLRKNRSKPPHDRNWTRGFQEHRYADEATAGEERVRAKGDLSRGRTIIQDEAPAENKGDEPADMPAPSTDECIPGRVLLVHGLISVVEAEDGRQYRCAVRRLL